jgi:hypothetical protein
VGINEDESISNITLRNKILGKEQLVVTKDVGINEDESLSNITLRNQY